MNHHPSHHHQFLQPSIPGSHSMHVTRAVPAAHGSTPASTGPVHVPMVYAPLPHNQPQMISGPNGTPVPMVCYYPSPTSTLSQAQRLHQANFSASRSSTSSQLPPPVQISGASPTQPPRPSSEPPPSSQTSSKQPELHQDFYWGYVNGQLKEVKAQRDAQILEMSYHSCDGVIGTTVFSYKGPLVNPLSDLTDALMKIKDQEFSFSKAAAAQAELSESDQPRHGAPVQPRTISEPAQPRPSEPTTQDVHVPADSGRNNNEEDN